jgi:hypothetical protein
MPNIHGALLHVPRPPAKKARFGAQAAGKAKERFQQATTGPRRQARQAWGNATSRPAEMKRVPRVQGALATSAITGLGAGGLAAGLASWPTQGKKIRGQKEQIVRNQREISTNAKTIRRQNREVAKLLKPRSRPHLITEMGTGAGRRRKRAESPWPLFHGPTFAGGAALGGAATVGMNRAELKAGQGHLQRQQTTLQNQRKKLNVSKSSVCAFGIDHGISKSVLTAKGREKIKAKNFAMPKSKSYPIHDRAHARNALARAAQSKTKGSYSAVAAKVHAKYPDIGR